MICVSLQAKQVTDLMDDLQRLQLAEVRFDGLALEAGDLERIFQTGCAIVATNRPAGQSDAKRARLLVQAVLAGARYVDVEVESSDDFLRQVKDAVTATDCRLIISYHNYETTPSADELKAVVQTCFDKGAHVAKVACQVHNSAQAARLLGLLDSDGIVLPIGMGAEGRITRIASPLLGAPFTFAALHPGKETAPGQLSLEELVGIYRQMGVLP